MEIQQHDSVVVEAAAISVGLRLSIATILSRWNMVEGGTAHG